ncbi:MAG: lytic transglycosylase domain-containing protein, partial [Firmicutes bacterium]|nr:lytic transglycosylase domain-containing protein [Bacillota bacterium]
MAANITCRLWRASAKILIPLAIFSIGILILVFSLDLDSKSSSILFSSSECITPQDLEQAGDKSGEPLIELPHPYDLIVATATEYAVDPALVLAVAAIESNYKVDAVSHKGAIGIMQLMPATAEELGVNPYILEENIEGGVKY